jgi:hypothetical protein
MVAVSKRQRRLMAMALEHPEMIQGKNSGVKNMTKTQLREFASTPEKGPPKKKRKKNG